MDNLYVVMPAYNEEENISDVVKSWYKVLDGKGEGSKLVVADSGSKDRTHEILLDLKKTYSKIEILENTITTHGPKLIAMYKYAVENGADFVFQTDSDGQTNPDEFGAFWQMRNDYDVILGNREVRGDGIARKMVENVVCLLLRIYYGVKVKDANAPFRLMKQEVLKKYIYRFKEDYNLPNIMLTAFFVYNNEKWTSKVITFKPRTKGVNSINIPRIFKIGMKALSDFADFKKKYF